MLRASCLVSNYNYRNYIGEAIDSALNQTVAFCEVVVVDDGSNDGSISYLLQQYSDEPRVRIVNKANGGQLSTFNVGLQHASGDLLFFLDADDRYQPCYLEAALDAYDHQQADFVISEVVNFGSDRVQPRKHYQRRDLGYSVVAALLNQTYVGGPTSAISMRREIAELILPYPDEHSWRIRADDVLVLAASILGARKFHLGLPLVEYRVHESNRYAGRRCGSADKLKHGLARNRLVEWYANKLGYNTERLAPQLHREFQTIEHPTRGEWWNYLKLSWRSRLSLSKRVQHLVATTRHYWQNSTAAALPSEPKEALSALQIARPTDIPAPPAGDIDRRGVA